MARAIVRQLVGADVLNADAPPPRLGAPRGPRVGWRVARGPSGSGLIGPGSGLRTRAALCTASLASPPRFLGTHCLLFPVILSARGRGSRLTAHLPAPAACSCFGRPFAGESVASKSGPAGAAWEDRLRSPRHPAPGDCLRLPSHQRATRGMSAMSPPAADLIRAPIMEERVTKGP